MNSHRQDLNCPKNYLTVTSQDIDLTEVFLVERDSTRGNAKQGREKISRNNAVTRKDIKYIGS